MTGRNRASPKSGGLVHVVNADPLESDTARMHAGRVRRPLRLPPARAEPPASEASEHIDTREAVGDRLGLRSDELWPWMAMTLIGLLLAESFLANRTAA